MACPICHRPASKDCRPFCSRRCADLDLGRWLTGAYAWPSEDAVAEEPADGERHPKDGETRSRDA